MAGGRWLLGQGPKGGDKIGPNPTDRGKNGVQRSRLVEADGGPLAVVVAGANVPDAHLLAETIESIVLERPEPEPGWEQHLCLDKGFDNDEGYGACVDHDYVPHIALIRDERPERPKPHKPRRWVVERTLSWLNQCRALLVRSETTADNYLALIKLACILLWYRRYHRLAF